jgi:hypothetical protein
MGAVLTVSSVLTCPNGGAVKTASSAKLTVQHNAVLNGLVSDQIAGCGASAPCATVATVAQGPASKLTAGGSPVLLDSVAAQSNTGAAVTAKTGAGQTKLTAS